MKESHFHLLFLQQQSNFHPTNKKIKCQEIIFTSVWLKVKKIHLFMEHIYTKKVDVAEYPPVAIFLFGQFSQLDFVKEDLNLSLEHQSRGFDLRL